MTPMQRSPHRPVARPPCRAGGGGGGGRPGILLPGTARPHRPKAARRVGVARAAKHAPPLSSLLGLLIALSVVTNVVVWTRHPFRRGGAGGMQHGGGGRTEADAWSRPPTRVGEDALLRRALRDGNERRERASGVVVDRIGDTANTHDDMNGGVRRDRRVEHNDNATSSGRTLMSKKMEGALKTTLDRAAKRKKEWKGHEEQGEQRAFPSKTKRSNSSTVREEIEETTRTGQRPPPQRKTSPDDRASEHKKEGKSHEERRERHTNTFESKTKQSNGSSVHEEINETTRTGQRSQRSQRKLRSFRPHPLGKRSRSPSRSLSLPALATESIKLNGLVLLDGIAGVSNATTYATLNSWLAGYNASNQSGDDGAEEDPSGGSQTVVWEDSKDCVPMSEWQTTFHPTCNSLHEMDVSLLVRDEAFSLASGKGYWRSAWRVDLEASGLRGAAGAPPALGTDGNKYAAMKSLKYVHDPNEETFELNRIDAVSLDVLTRSRFTINIHGYCGTSSVQEFAGGDLKGLLPKLDPVDKLRMAAWIAEGVADIHAVDELDKGRLAGNVGGPKNDTATEDVPMPSLIHNDINMDNALLGHRQGVEVPLLNDFNIAVFRKKHAKTGEPCRFRGRFANPQWMSPEQQERPEDELSTGYLNEKIDIYALGNILYKIAVGHSPWKYDYKVTSLNSDMRAKTARAKLRGAKPKVPPEVRNTTDSSVKAVLHAMDRCYRNDAELRPSARELAGYLKSELNAVEISNSV